MRVTQLLCKRMSNLAANVGRRSYADAISCLNSTQSNAAVIEAIRKSGGKGGEEQVQESLEYLRRIGYNAEDLNRLNVIHITGTKGKGSTSAFTDSILRTMAPTTRTGLYTSPHLVAVRERIRINGKPIEEETFAKYFFEIWDLLEKNANRADSVNTTEKPAYFRYLTLMAFHVFLKEKVDATILEVGVGGTYDSTNIVPQPLVTGVSSLGLDHIFVLGKTLPEIAAQKGGIYKPGVPALAVDQPSEGLDVLRSRAKELGASSFDIIPVHPQLSTIVLGLAGLHQRINASLAIGLVQAFLASPRLPSAFSKYGIPIPSPVPVSKRSSSELKELTTKFLLPSPLPKQMVEGLESTRWPGRCQIATDSQNENLQWYLDGAHTTESLKCCGDWYGDTSFAIAGHLDYSMQQEQTNRSNGFEQKEKQRLLIFNCTSGRSGLSLLGTLLKALAPKSASPFERVIFCTNTTYQSGTSKGDLSSNAIDVKDLDALTVQNELAEAWAQLQSSEPNSRVSSTKVQILGSIEEAVKVARSICEEKDDVGVDALVTGSLHLVGGIMAVADLPLEN